MSKAKGGLILGIVALVSAILGCVGPFGFTVSMILILASLPLAIVGLVLSVMGGKELKVAVANSTGAAKELIQRIKAGDASYAFVEVMACPGGCVNGGGQPIVSAYKRMDVDPRAARAAGLYAEDESKTIRKSHENPDIQKLYAEFLGEPNGHLAHKLLHTEYIDRSDD